MIEKRNTKLKSQNHGSQEMDLNYRPTFLLGGGGDENSFKLSSNDI